MVVLLVGLALGAISMTAAAAFFLQSNTKAKALMGESESMTHLSILLKQSFNKQRCLELDIYKGQFKKQIVNPIILSDESPSSGPEQAKGGPKSTFNSESVSLLRNSIGKSYDISRVQMIQRTGVIGMDPGRVLADLKVGVVYRAQVAKKEKVEPQILTIPMLFDVDPNFKAIGCMQTPMPEDICKKNNGTFNAKATSQLCVLKKR